MIEAESWWTKFCQPRVIGYWQGSVFNSIDSIGYSLEHSSSNYSNQSSSYKSKDEVYGHPTEPLARKLNCLELSTRSTVVSSDEGGSDQNASSVESYSVVGGANDDDDGMPTTKVPRVFVYPTWSLLGRNLCNDTSNVTASSASARHSPSLGITNSRSQSTPPPLKNAKIAQRSSHTKMMVASRRCRSIGRSKGISTANHLRPRHTRGDDFRSLENVNIPALQAMSSTDEKTACNALFRQDTRRIWGGHVGRCHRSPMDHPYFIWTLLTGNQSAISRIKLLHLLSLVQLEKKHECHENCCLLQHKWRNSNITYDSSSKLTLLQGGHTIMGLGKAQNEDAFSCPVTPGFSHSSGGTFVLADGVGEWRQYGLSSSAFAQEVVKAAHHCLDTRLLKITTSVDNQGKRDSTTVFDILVNSLLDGHKATTTEILPTYGACTIIAGMVHDKDKLTVASLGDCQVMQLRRDVIRKMRMVIVKKSKITQHSFNTPKQLVNCPDELDYDRLCNEGREGTVKHIKAMREKAREIGFDITSDDPVTSSMTEFKLREGDLLLCGSDGLFDNLYDDEISQLCSYAMSPFESKLLQNMWNPNATGDETDEEGPQLEPHSNLDNAWLEGCLAHPCAMEPPAFIIDPITREKAYYTDPSNLAKGLVEAAAARGMDPAATVPFGKAARRAGFYDMTIGGKTDDTTCIAMWVTPERTTQHPST